MSSIETSGRNHASAKLHSKSVDPTTQNPFMGYVAVLGIALVFGSPIWMLLLMCVLSVIA